MGALPVLVGAGVAWACQAVMERREVELMHCEEGPCGRLDALVRTSLTLRGLTTLGERGTLPQSVVTVDLHAGREARWGCKGT